MIRIKGKENKVITIEKMLDGQIAEVVSCRNYGGVVGDIVQRSGEMLIHIGKKHGSIRTTFFNGGDIKTGWRVRLLTEDDILIVDNNHIEV
jgi:hypothetical protein